MSNQHPTIASDFTSYEVVESIDALTRVGARSVESSVGLVRAVEIKPLPMIIKSALEFFASRK